MICKEINQGYEIEFIEIGTDKDHVHPGIKIPIFKPDQYVQAEAK